MSSHEQNNPDATNTDSQRPGDSSPPDVSGNVSRKKQTHVSKSSGPTFSRRQILQLALVGLVSLAGGSVIVSELARRYGLWDTTVFAPGTDSAPSMAAHLQPSARPQNTPMPATPTSQPSATPTLSPSPMPTDTVAPSPDTVAPSQPSATPTLSPSPDTVASSPDAVAPSPDMATVQPDIHTVVAVPKPPIVSHAEWGGIQPTRPFIPHQIERITLHHEGVYFDGSIPAASYIQQVQHWCLTNRMWPDIPYHFLIDLEGTIYEGRPLEAQGDTNTGYSTAGHAQVAVLGKYDAGEQVPNQQQLAAIIDIMAWIAATYQIPVDDDHIKGHRDYIPFDHTRGFHIDDRTGEKITCPGDNLYIYLENDTILNGIAERLAIARNSEPTPTSMPDIYVHQIR